MEKKKSISVLVALGMLLPTNLTAQEQSRSGGLFGETSTNTSCGMMGRGSGTAMGYFNGQSFGETNGTITGQTFGDDAPLGSGLFVLFAAGAGYVSMKSKKNRNIQNSKEN